MTESVAVERVSSKLPKIKIIDFFITLKCVFPLPLTIVKIRDKPFEHLIISLIAVLINGAVPENLECRHQVVSMGSLYN